MELGLSCKVQTRKGLLEHRLQPNALAQMRGMRKDPKKPPIRIALERSGYTCKSNRRSIFQLACCADDVRVLSS